MAEQQFNTELSVWTNTINSLIVRDFEENNVEYDEYSRKCAMNAMSSIYNLVKANGNKISEIDTSNLRDIVGQTASLKLNPNALPRECYYKLVTKNIGGEWVKQVEMQPEGTGYESMLRNFGVGVKKVYPTWIVHEGDEFIYPRRKGLEVAPPEWEEKGVSQKVIRVVVPVEMVDGTIEYKISERDSVKGNLYAHVKNNLLNETFGLLKGNNSKGKPKTRYDATPEEKQAIDAEKHKIFDALRACPTVEDMLACEIARPYISGAWLDTPEAMITRKLINNACRSFPKDFSALAQKSMIELDETYKRSQEEIEENENSIPFDDADVIDSTAREVTVDAVDGAK